MRCVEGVGKEGEAVEDVASALRQADERLGRINAAQTSPTFPVEFDDPDEEEDDEEDTKPVDEDEE